MWLADTTSQVNTLILIVGGRGRAIGVEIAYDQDQRVFLSVRKQQVDRSPCPTEISDRQQAAQRQVQLLWLADTTSQVNTFQDRMHVRRQKIVDGKRPVTNLHYTLPLKKYPAEKTRIG